MNSNMYCEIVQQSMIPSLQKLGSRAVLQHDNDPKHISKTTIMKYEGCTHFFDRLYIYIYI